MLELTHKKNPSYMPVCGHSVRLGSAVARTVGMNGGYRVTRLASRHWNVCLKMTIYLQSFSYII